MEFGELNSNKRNLKILNQYLKENFGITVSTNTTVAQVNTWMNSVNREPDMRKRIYLKEALKIVLKEIAPKRKRKKTNESTLMEQALPALIDPSTGAITTQSGSGGKIKFTTRSGNVIDITDALKKNPRVATQYANQINTRTIGLMSPEDLERLKKLKPANNNNYRTIVGNQADEALKRTSWIAKNAGKLKWLGRASGVLAVIDGIFSPSELADGTLPLEYQLAQDLALNGDWKKANELYPLEGEGQQTWEQFSNSASAKAFRSSQTTGDGPEEIDPSDEAEDIANVKRIQALQNFKDIEQAAAAEYRDQQAELKKDADKVDTAGLPQPKVEPAPEQPVEPETEPAPEPPANDPGPDPRGPNVVPLPTPRPNVEPFKPDTTPPAEPGPEPANDPEPPKKPETPAEPEKEPKKPEPEKKPDIAPPPPRPTIPEPEIAPDITPAPEQPPVEVPEPTQPEPIKKPEDQPDVEPAPSTEPAPIEVPTPRPDIQPQPGPEIAPDIAPEPAPEPQPQTEPQPQPEPQPQTEPAPAPEPAPQPGPITKPAPITQPAPAPVTKPQPNIQTQPQTITQPAPQAAPKLNTQPRINPVPRTQGGKPGAAVRPRVGIPGMGGRSGNQKADTYQNWQWSRVPDEYEYNVGGLGPMGLDKPKKPGAQLETKETTTMKKQYMEGFSKLMEQDLDSAELLLAAKDMVDRLQKMAEDVASMQVEDLMSLVDAMRDQFGVDKAEAFNASVESALQSSLDNIKATHSSVDNAIAVLSGEAPEGANDMGAIPGGDMETPADPAPDMDIDMDGSEPAAGPDDAPEGREKKDESFESVQTSLFDALSEGQLGKGLLRTVAKKLK